MPLRAISRDQNWLLPASTDDWIGADHPARFVAAFVDALDRAALRDLSVVAEGAAIGAPAYPPRLLLSVWLYGFLRGVRSSRKLEVACQENLPFLWLTGGSQPDHNTLWRFYQAHRQAMIGQAHRASGFDSRSRRVLAFLPASKKPCGSRGACGLVNFSA